MVTTPLIDCLNLVKTVATPEGTLSIIESITLQIQSGESVAIMGPSGSGKSTLLSLLAGLDVATAGSVHLFGQPLASMNEEARAALRSGKVGFVFQSFELIPSLNALDNVSLPLELLGDKAAVAKAQSSLESVGLGHRLSHFPTTLSGGEQQRVAIARAYVTSPQIVFADEPTGNLDSTTGAHIIELMFAHQRKGSALILVTHDPALAARCDRKIQLHSGKICS